MPDNFLNLPHNTLISNILQPEQLSEKLSELLPELTSDLYTELQSDKYPEYLSEIAAKIPSEKVIHICSKMVDNIDSTAILLFGITYGNISLLHVETDGFVYRSRSDGAFFSG